MAHRSDIRVGVDLFQFILDGGKVFTNRNGVLFVHEIIARRCITGIWGAEHGEVL